MKSINKQLFEGSYPHLARLASFILEQNLNSFVEKHFERCASYDALSLNHLSVKKRRDLQNMFHKSCENWLRSFIAYTGEKLIIKSIDEAFEYELAPSGKSTLTIDDIIMVSYIRAESLKIWIGEYTSDVEVALAIVKELDCFTATHNAIAFQRYSRLLVSKLEMNNDTLRMSNEKLREFAAVVSHDLKAPLRRISSYFELIHETISEGDINNVSIYLAKTKNATSKMAELIDKLLSFASLDNQQQKKDHCDLNIVLQEVIENLEPTIKEKNATIVTDKLPPIKAVSFQMEQMFQNIIANSLKFCKKDLPPIVEITSQITEKNARPSLVLEIKDNCIGFKNKHLEKVFSAFTRLHDQYEGTGLGLAICKKIIDNHGGSISVRSEEGVGTVFRIELPMDGNQ